MITRKLSIKQKRLDGTIRIIEDIARGCSKEELKENIFKLKERYKSREVGNRIVQPVTNKVSVKSYSR